ncbi:MAG: hypothetical protein ACMG6S_15970, partial [Byssovorax sp.]
MGVLDEERHGGVDAGATLLERRVGHVGGARGKIERDVAVDVAAGRAHEAGAVVRAPDLLAEIEALRGRRVVVVEDDDGHRRFASLARALLLEVLALRDPGRRVRRRPAAAAVELIALLADRAAVERIAAVTLVRARAASAAVARILPAAVDGILPAAVGAVGEAEIVGRMRRGEAEEREHAEREGDERGEREERRGGAAG